MEQIDDNEQVGLGEDSLGECGDIFIYREETATTYAEGVEIGNMLSDDDTLDMTECQTVEMDFISGLQKGL